MSVLSVKFWKVGTVAGVMCDNDFDYDYCSCSPDGQRILSYITSLPAAESFVYFSSVQLLHFGLI